MNFWFRRHEISDLLRHCDILLILKNMFKENTSKSLLLGTLIFWDFSRLLSFQNLNIKI